MANQVSLVLNLCCFVILLANSIQADSNDNRKVHVVYMGQKTRDDVAATSLHLSMLRQVAGRDGGKYMLQRYTKSFHGFSARLTKEEAKKLSGMEGVVSVFPSRKHILATTSSWNFMGFPLTVNRSTTESDIIIGVFDSGIWPESASFSDLGYGPPPAKWKGICQNNFPCNNKIIGAQYFRGDGTYGPKDLHTPRDSNGHGTHTASIAAGNEVIDANLLGLGSGTARGGVPRARIAVYKVCWTDGCSDADILSAFDTAIADGVDIISASIGSQRVVALFRDAISIGSFHAMMKGILTVQSAGNNGPDPKTTTSIAPWILSVAAGTKNPDLITPVRLGDTFSSWHTDAMLKVTTAYDVNPTNATMINNGPDPHNTFCVAPWVAADTKNPDLITPVRLTNNNVIEGVSVNPFTLDRMYPLVFAGDVPNTADGFNGSISRHCENNSLDKKLVQGKIILCDSISTGEPEMLAGAVGSIIPYEGPKFESITSYPLPVSVVNFDQAKSIYDYIHSTRNPTAVIMKSEDVTNPSSPYVASFSSRGPNTVYTNILKPDLTAPGVRILAAWSPLSPISQAEGDHREVRFNMMSGTSMACPHVSGIAAYIKSFNPTWSPTAIKSALMTTAVMMSAQSNTDAEFAYGAGYLNPMNAIRPGLVYDVDEADYVTFLCQQGYSTQHIRIITGVNISSCSELMKPIIDFNYPAFVIPTMPNEAVDFTFSRTVTNVGLATSTYTAFISQPPAGLRIQVDPSVLQFEEYGQKLSFKLNVQSTIQKLDNPVISCGLTWYDGVHPVRSPIVVHVP